MSLSFPLNMDEFWNREKQFFGELLLKRLVVLLFTLSFIQPSVASVPDSESYYGDTDYVFDIPIVLTPTRLEQPVSQIPGTVTTITQDQIQKYGINRISEALRLVPGMVVDSLFYSNPHISYHGAIGYVPRRIKILIDNIEFYQAGSARVDWSSIPVEIEAIEKIEIVRGPSSASHGDNAFLAVINIITSEAGVQPGWKTSITTGSLNTSKVRVSHESALPSDSGIRISGSTNSTSGYDQDINNNRIQDDTSTNKLNIRFDSTVDKTKYILFTNYASNDLDNSEIETDNRQSLLSSVTIETSINSKHFLKYDATYRQEETKKEWSACLPPILFTDELTALYNLNPELTISLYTDQTIVNNSSLTPQEALLIGALALRNETLPDKDMCGELNENYKDSEFSFGIQDTWTSSKRLRIASGSSLRFTKVESETYLGDTVSREIFGVYSNGEYMVSQDSWLNLGGYLELQEGVKTQFSPRIGFIYEFRDNNFLKIVRSSAVRTPDLLETEGHWSYTMTNIDPIFFGTSEKRAFLVASSQTKLKPEKIVSTELIFYGRLESARMNWDLKFFHEEMENLISDRSIFIDFNPTNKSYVDLKGAEFSLTYHIDRTNQLHWNHSTLNSDTNSEIERLSIPNHVGMLSLESDWNKNIRSVLSHYYTERDTSSFEYRRTDITLGYNRKLGPRKRFTSIFTLSYFDTQGYEFALDTSNQTNDTIAGNASFINSFSMGFDSRWQAFLQLSVDL